MERSLLLVLMCCSAVFCAEQCCPNNGKIAFGRCENSTSSVNRNCTNGHMLLRDIIMSGDKVSTADAPGFVFVQDPSQYCISTTYKNASNHSLGTIPVAVVCFENIPSQSSDLESMSILTFVSVFFLFLTLAVYVYLPQMRDLQGLCYMCFCVSMALGFLSLGILQLSPGFSGQLCTVTGFLVYFWMVSTFFWMNVICINMYRTVQDASYLKKTEKKQYFFYSCYAWGGPLLFLMIALITNFAEGDHLKPGIGENSCWFSGRAETWLYFYGPVAILISSNIALFLLSSVILWRKTRKYEMNMLNILKHKFLLSLKLFLVMGISWVFEIASFAHGENHIVWKIMDTFNCLQGVVIFVLLVVLRRRAINGLANENILLPITRPLADKLSPHDDADDQEVLADDTMEVRLN